jgi:cytochrome c-type biogenesis protein CcsB
VNEFTTPTVWTALGAALFAAALFYRASFAESSVSPRPSPGRVNLGPLSPRRLSNGAGAAPAQWAATASAILLVVALVLRWQATDRPPLTNMWEFTVAFAASVAVFFVLFDRRLNAAPAVGVLVQTLIAALLLVALLIFSAEVEPLVPALQSEWILFIHVGLMVASYGALALSFGSAVARLAQGDRERFRILPSTRVLDRLSYASVVVGFPLLTAGVLLGAYWANDAWGRYWGWDPKETSSLVTWFIYGAYLHVHSIASWRGSRSAIILVAGFAAVMFTYFGVNLWIAGLHSYA